MRINKLTISNFKVFRELDLTFNGRSAVIFGINGTGKSTVLSAINYIFRVFLNQMNSSQSKAFEKFDDDSISIGCDRLEITATVKLKENHILERNYKRSIRNSRSAELTYPKKNYDRFKESFRKLYLSSDDIGMPIYVYYGTNRAVWDIPDKSKGDQTFDKLSAIARAIDPKLDFQAFFDWFRDKEAEEILKIRDSKDYDYVSPELRCVRKAVETMLGDVSNLRIERDPVRMVVDKEGKEIRVDMLSDGEKCTLALLGDLARRLVLANPHADDPLKGVGIVLIDEVDLHMHPSWQRRILPTLRDLFPNIQFIVTTHSPQVLGEVGDDYDIFGFSLDDEGNGAVNAQIKRMDGYDSNMILEEYMATSSESNTKRVLVKSLNEAIRHGHYDLARKKLDELRDLSGEDDAEYILSEGYLRRRSAE